MAIQSHSIPGIHSGTPFERYHAIRNFAERQSVTGHFDTQHFAPKESFSKKIEFERNVFQNNYL